MEKEIIPVFFSADDNYAPYLAVAIASLIANASTDYDYRIVILHDGMSRSNQRKIAALALSGFSIEFVVMENRLSCITDRIGNRLRADYFTLTIYFRLFIPVMFPEYDRGIYLDSDIVVSGDISELYRQPLRDRLIGACTDFSVQEVPPLVKYITFGVGVPAHEYVNSGILLMNMRRLREVHLEERFLELYGRYHFDCIAPDQDYLNAMCHGSILYLDECWDAMPNNNKPPMEYPKIIHYNLFEKPWMYDNVQYADYFWHYAALSGYDKVIRRFKACYGEAQRLSDSQHLALLIRRGEQIADSELNFRTVFGGGLEERLR